MEGFDLRGLGVSRRPRVLASALREPEAKQQSKNNPFGLSAREMTVLYLLTDGLADKEIATTLGVTPYTVNKHVGAILIKMNVRSRTAAAVRAVKTRLFPDDSIDVLAELPFGQDPPAAR